MTQPESHVTPEASLYGAEPKPVVPTPISFGDLVVGLFTEPGVTFDRLKARPEWLTAMLVILGCGLALAILWVAKADHAGMAEARFDVLRQAFGMQMPDQAVQEAVEKAGNSRPFVATALGSLIGPWFVSALIGVICWGLARLSTPLSAEPATFKQGFSLAAVHQLALLPGQIATLAMVAIKPVGAASVMVLNPLSLGFFMRSENPWVRGLFVGLGDPLYLFSFVLLAIGMRRMLGAKTWAIAVALGVMALVGMPLRYFGGMF